MTSIAEARRWTARAGIVAALFFAAVILLGVAAPESDATPVSVATYAEQSRAKILTLVYLQGLCICASMVFLIGLGMLCGHAECHGAGGPHVPFFSVVGMSTGVALFTADAIGTGAVGEMALDPDRWVSQQELAKLLLGFFQITVNMTGFLTAVSNMGFCCALHRVFLPATSRRLVAAGWVLAALHLVSGGAFAKTGFLAPSGLGVFVCAPCYYAWMVAISICLLRSPCLHPLSPDLLSAA